jgi:hypothetical protein
MMVATFGYLDISIMARRCQYAIVRARATLLTLFNAILLLQIFYDAVPVKFTVEAIHLRQLCPELVSVALGQASHHDYLVELAPFLLFDEGQNHVYAFLLGCLNKAAGINNGHAAVSLLGITPCSESDATKRINKMLRIDQILGTTHGDNVNVSSDSHVLST